MADGDVRTISTGSHGWYAATSEHLLRSIDWGQSWDTLDIPVPFIGDFTSVVVIPNTETVIFSAEPGVYRSTDEGATWLWAGEKAVGMYSLAVDSAGRVFASGSFGILRSSDDGASWDSVHTNPGPFTDGLLVIPDGTVLSASITGGLLASVDAGAQWDSLRGLATPPGLVTSMAASPISGTLLVSVAHIHNTGAGAPLYRSTDAGATWTVVDSGNVLLDALSADAQGNFYVGGDAVRRSTDDGQSWHSFGVGYPEGGHVSAIVPIGGSIYACDRNFGILVLDPAATTVEADPEIPVSTELLQNHPNPFNATTMIRYRVDAAVDRSSLIRLAIYDLLGQELTVLFEGPAAIGDHTVRWDAASAPSGIYLVVLDRIDGLLAMPSVRQVRSMVLIK